VTDDEVERLRALASRRNYASMARLARVLYDRGLDPQNVLFECYGVGFPDEFFAVAEQRTVRPRLLAQFTDLPWRLAVPPGRGGPPHLGGGITAPTEQKILTMDADLLPLMTLGAVGFSHDSVTVCYRLSRLADDRTDVFAVKGPRDPIVRRDDSLLAVLHAHHTEHLRWMEWYVEQPWVWGIEALPDRAVDEVRSLVARIEALQRRGHPEGD
jgi:hypothetical protein